MLDPSYPLHRVGANTIRELQPRSLLRKLLTNFTHLLAMLLWVGGVLGFLAAVMGKDETNLVVTSLARFKFNVPRTIARVHQPMHAWMFTPAMGVDVALNQADLLAHFIAEEISKGGTI